MRLGGVRNLSLGSRSVEKGTGGVGNGSSGSPIGFLAVRASAQMSEPIELAFVSVRLFNYLIGLSKRLVTLDAFPILRNPPNSIVIFPVASSASQTDRRSAFFARRLPFVNSLIGVFRPCHQTASTCTAFLLPA